MYQNLISSDIGISSIIIFDDILEFLTYQKFKDIFEVLVLQICGHIWHSNTLDMPVCQNSWNIDILEILMHQSF